MQENVCSGGSKHAENSSDKKNLSLILIL